MAKLNPYLIFNGNCREAMTFYKKCLGGELMLQTVEGTPAAEHVPAEARQQILHSILTNGDLVLMATDMSQGDEPIHGNTMSLTLNCSSDDEIQRCFAGLAEGGTVTMPLGAQFWGATFGQLVDRYGFRWMLNYDKNQPA